MKKHRLKVIIVLVIAVLIVVFMVRNHAVQYFAAGLAIFLLGMMFLSEGFKEINGGFLEKLLRKFSGTKTTSVIFGALTTMIMQSSTLVTILSLSFLSASLITLGQALGIVFGANIGSTTSGWIIAGIGLKLDISILGMPLIAIGVLMMFMKDNINLKALGKILAGVGFFFLGIAYIKTGFNGYANSFSFNFGDKNYVLAFSIFFILGIVITSIIQSSFATLTIIILALNAGTITYDNALALVIGTNVGGVVTALIASISASLDSKKLAIGNTIFNIAIAIVCIALLPYFKDIVNFLDDLFRFDPKNYTLKIALFHTTYNVIAVLLMTPFIPLFEKALNKMLKSKKSQVDMPRYIDPSLIPYINTATEALQREVRHLFSNARYVLSVSVGLSLDKLKQGSLSASDLDNYEWVDISLKDLYDQKIRAIFDGIIEFSSSLSLASGDEKFSKEIFALQNSARSLAEATRNLITLHTHLRKFANSKNKILTEQYLQLRLMFGFLICELEEVLTFKEDSMESKTRLKNLKESFKLKDKNALKEVEKLLSNKLLEVDVATSLLSDISFSFNVAKDFINSTGYLIKLHKHDE
ncbi:Na/Pi symporter [Helicobacter sp. 11S02629-2]|uniref:Na/Pi cotransporter family protein n=1 Tax=Helicobacter sp. 11S02629-2 TaxID=1476195 RepID=UPI0015DAE0FB|nr:Na/Pi symporter [Helicobacter sp. 11S02629-2]